MVQGICIHEFGGPEVLRWESVEVGKPGPGEVRLRHTAIGLNYVDTIWRRGGFDVPLPFVPGREGVGVVEAVGEGVTLFQTGDRVGYAPITGSYAEARLIEAKSIVKLPDAIDDATGAAMMLKGMTAQYLLRQIRPVQAGDTVLIHAAAGGMGLILCQWAKALGATVLGTVSTDEKAALAAANGCDHPIIYTREDFVVRVQSITDGDGADFVIDGVGKDTFHRSLDCMKRRGHIVSFGEASGPIPPIDIAELGKRGSLTATRASLMSFIPIRKELEVVAQDLFDVVLSGAVRIHIQQTYPLSEAAEAHRALEARETTGSTVFTL